MKVLVTNHQSQCSDFLAGGYHGVCASCGSLGWLAWGAGVRLLALDDLGCPANEVGDSRDDEVAFRDYVDRRAVVSLIRSASRIDVVQKPTTRLRAGAQPAVQR